MKGSKGKEQGTHSAHRSGGAMGLVLSRPGLAFFLGPFGSITSGQEKTRLVQVYPEVTAVCQLCAHFQ